MYDNKEDLIVLVQVEPVYKFNGIRKAVFENFGGVLRD
jgi:hypothetical protein